MICLFNYTQNIIFTNTGGAIEAVADFSGLGATTRRLEIFSGDQLVYESGHYDASTGELDHGE